MSEENRERPSKIAKLKVGSLAEQQLLECGRLARDLCNNSGSRDVLVKAAKRMALNEQSMENTLQVMACWCIPLMSHVFIDFEAYGVGG